MAGLTTLVVRGLGVAGLTTLVVRGLGVAGLTTLVVRGLGVAGLTTLVVRGLGVAGLTTLVVDELGLGRDADGDALREGGVASEAEDSGDGGYGGGDAKGDESLHGEFLR